MLLNLNTSKSQVPWDYYGITHIYNTNEGNVGIGDGNPFMASEKLEVLGNLKLRGGIKVEGTSYNLGNFSIGTENNYNSMLNIYSGDINKLYIGGNTDYNRITFTDQSGYNSYLDIKSSSDGYFNFSNINNEDLPLLRINNSGNIGIGTTTPAYTLDVNGPINATDILKNGQSIAYWGQYGSSIYYSNGNVGIGTDIPSWGLHVKNSTGWKAMFEGTDGTGIAFSDQYGLAWINYFGGSSGYMDFFNKFRITNNGNIGINNANPNYKLDVGGVINATDILKNGQALGQWSVNGTNLYYNDGNIGIGTNNPQQKLDVNGTISVSGDPSSFPLRFSAIGNNDWGIEFTGVPTLELNNKQSNLNKNGKDGAYQFEVGMGLRIRDDGMNAFYIKDKISNQYRMVFSQGKVGIATNAPNYTLDVNGTINAMDILKNGQPLSTSQWQNNGSNIYYNNGNIGLNTNNPLELLQLGDRFVFHNGGQKIIGYNYHYDGQDKRILQAPVSNLCLRDDGSILFRTAPADVAGSVINWTNSLLISNAGKVCIGMMTPYLIYSQPATLSVNGSIVSKEMHVRVNGWPDFIFKNGYNLKTLEEVESYINENGHLEGIPSEKDVKDNGIELGNTTKILLQKIEELTLYIIEQNKKIKELEDKVNN